MEALWIWDEEEDDVFDSAARFDQRQLNGRKPRGGQDGQVTCNRRSRS